MFPQKKSKGIMRPEEKMEEIRRQKRERVEKEKRKVSQTHST